MMKSMKPSPTLPSTSYQDLEEKRKGEQQFFLCQTCSVVSGHACILPVDRRDLSLVNQLQSLKWEKGG